MNFPELVLLLRLVFEAKICHFFLTYCTVQATVVCLLFSCLYIHDISGVPLIEHIVRENPVTVQCHEGVSLSSNKKRIELEDGWVKQCLVDTQRLRGH